MTTFSDPGFRISGPDEDPIENLDEAEALDEAIDDEAIDELEELEAEFDDETEATDEADLEADDLEVDNEVDLEAPELDEEHPELIENELEPSQVEDEIQDEIQDTTDLTEETAPAPSEAEPEWPKDEPTVAAVPIPAPAPASTDASPFWSMRQMAMVAQRVLAIFVVMGMVGYLLGASRGSSNVARAEFVYTLDESVPDSFLREDRRLLTQVVTFKSDAVLTPVAAEFDLTVDQLRAKIDVETLNLSEVLRLDVTDKSAEQAVAISRAVLDRYLQVITDATPVGDGEELAQQRADVTAKLADADASRQALVEDRQQDAALEIEQESIQRQIDNRNQQLNRLQGSLDDSLVQVLSTARIESLEEQLETTRALVSDLESDLIRVVSERAALATDTTAEPALLREIDRLESILTTIDDEFAQRELGPLVASPIRELSDPVILFRSRHIVGLQGMALGLMAGVPIAAFVAYRVRKRQLWFDQ